MGPAGPVSLGPAMECEHSIAGGRSTRTPYFRIRYQLIVILFAVCVFVGTMLSPPALLDDVDAVQAQIARNMLASGDWVTARLDGVKYLEKSPLNYWLMAICFRVFGVHDWAARIPSALSAVLLCWLVAAFA